MVNRNPYWQNLRHRSSSSSSSALSRGIILAWLLCSFPLAVSRRTVTCILPAGTHHIGAVVHPGHIIERIATTFPVRSTTLLAAPSFIHTMARRAEAGTEHAVTGSNKIGGSFTPTKNAEFIKRRNEVFEKLYQKQEEERKNKAQDDIKVTLPDGTVYNGKRHCTTPRDVALSISKKLAASAVIAEILLADTANSGDQLVCAEEEAEGDDEECCSHHVENSWQLWDLTRPLEEDCGLKLLMFSDPEGQMVFWHSSAHILGQCLEAEYGAHLTVGPALTSGFYYDSYMGENTLNDDAYSLLEKHAERICKEDQPFQRLVCTREEALEMFKDNPFKVQLITNKIPAEGKTSVYRCGPLIDLCRGPHLPTTGRVKAFSIRKNSAAYWLGQKELDSLQRVYGISFPDNAQLKEYKALVEEAKKRDHRTVGNALNLFFFETNVSAGSCFWMPDGTRIYNKLCNFMRSEYRARGFSEVISPNIFSCDLWKTSGHYDNYKENMYIFDLEGKEWGLKPMNCPGHCIMFKHMFPSYRQLPIRLADFGVLHRNETSGSLTGLTRVRRFQQDDAHIFCTVEQIKAEVMSALDFLFFVYGAFGFRYELKLSTRPKKALGSRELWDQAEEALRDALNSCGKPWTLNLGDGAFYGPKIDIRLWDALKRPHQCGTVQLDFQLPIRFNLQYRTQDEIILDKKEDEEKEQLAAAAPTAGDGFQEQALRPGCARPVIIHRAILGSVERMCAVLLEHTAGKFPFWLSPRQAIVLPVSAKSNEYAHWIKDTLLNFDYDVSIDDSDNTISKKVRDAQVQQWNYMLVVGAQEVDHQTVTLRRRDDQKNLEEMTLEKLLEVFENDKMPNSKPEKKIVPWKGASRPSGE